MFCVLCLCVFFFVMIRRPPRATLDRPAAASDVYKRQGDGFVMGHADARHHGTREHRGAGRALQLADPGLQHEDRAVEVDTHHFAVGFDARAVQRCDQGCLLSTSPRPRDRTRSRMPSSA